MAFLGNLMAATGNAISAFRETMLNADPQQGRAGSAFDLGSWDRWESRQVRYDLYNGLYANNAYRDLVHPWAPRVKTAFATSKHIRHVYNPAHRLVEFFANHLQGGLLDPGAGDGVSAPSALPILTDAEALRPMLGKLWRDSRWQVHKDLYARWGSMLGDAVLKGVADPELGQVRIEVEHPGHLKWVDRDASGEVRAYILQKWIVDPRDRDVRDASPTADPCSQLRRVRYYEKCFLDGRDVVWQVFLDDEAQPEVVKPYGFIPLEVVHHKATGLDWGENCFHGGLSRFLEIDDQASCLGDQIRRLLHSPTLIAGTLSTSQARPAGVDRSARTPDQVGANPEPERSEMRFRYTSEKDVKALPLYADMDLAGVCQHILMLGGDIEKNFPELLADAGNLVGTVTAEAVRNARQVAGNRVQATRPAYDDPLARLQKKLLAIAGHEGFEGYRGASLEAYASGGLDHAIGHRPVFEVNPMDRLEEDAAFWKNAIAAKTSGVPLSLFLKRNGWSDADLSELKKAQALEPVPTTTINLGQTGGNPVDHGEGL